jgi:hypothetical protein
MELLHQKDSEKEKENSLCGERAVIVAQAMLQRL